VDRQPFQLNSQPKEIDAVIKAIIAQKPTAKKHATKALAAKTSATENL
jgi:hypothetical protein